MKKILLVSVLTLLCNSFSYGQAIANTPPDMSACFEYLEDASFDLTTQIPAILGEQNPEDYTVTFFRYYKNPEIISQAMQNPQDFHTVGSASFNELVYARVDSNNDDSYAITSFTVTTIQFEFIEFTMTFCEGYVVPEINIGNFYSEPGGMGTVYNSGEFIVEPTTIYAYAEYEGCILETEIDAMPQFINFSDPLEPYEGCDANGDGIAVFNLQSLTPVLTGGLNGYSVNYYETEEDAENSTNRITNIQNFYNTIPYSQIIYAQKINISFCSSVAPLELIAAPCENSVISGTVTFDVAGNNCFDNTMPAANIQVNYTTDSNQSYVTHTDTNGNYHFNNIPDSHGSISIVQSNEVYASQPQAYDVNLAGDEVTYNFCLGLSHSNNAAIALSPISEARPGFEAKYRVTIQNLGNENIANGSAIIEFDASKLSYISNNNSDIVQTGNILTYNFEDIDPFETKFKIVKFNVIPPPTVNGGDIINFTASLTDSDDNADDNVSLLNQTVVNAYDPNDIIVHEGEFITEEQADGYLNYTIRFQNEGNGNAINVKINTLLNENLDWDTFQTVTASHNYRTIRNGNEVEFVFNNINLPTANMNQEWSKGFISYRIKPVEDIALGDVISASAGIYFDFNPAVLTNTVTTTVELLGANRVSSNNMFIIYPNPATSDNVIVKLNGNANDASITITDISGKIITTIPAGNDELLVNISSLSKGMYFVTLRSSHTSSTKKLIIQ